MLVKDLEQSSLLMGNVLPNEGVEFELNELALVD